MLTFCIDHFIAIGFLSQVFLFLILPLAIKEFKFRRKMASEKPVEIDNVFMNNN